MVFQNIANYYLNSVLSLYIKDYKSDQLNLQFGTALLKDLYVKESAINSLKLPVKLRHGYIESLKLKVNFNNFYNAKLSLEISDVYLVFMPNFSYEPNEEEERKSQWEAKKAMLEKIEQSLIKLTEKPENEIDTSDDSFVTKVILQIFNNVQIKISNVHIRLEDTYSHPQKCFTFGLTFSTLEFVSRAQEDEIRYRPSNTGSIILKAAKLSHLSIYFNTFAEHDQRMLSTLGDLSEVNREMRQLIANDRNTPTSLDYILVPDQFVANMFVHRKPQEDSFKLPSLDVEMVLDRFSVTFSKMQYDSLLYLLENVNQLTVAAAYRKWRPKVTLVQRPRDWWKFAYTVILETDVHRRRGNWSWNHMKEYISARKKYKMLYKKKLVNKSHRPETHLIEMLDKIEEQLDISTIVLIRKQVWFEVRDLLQQQQKEKVAAQNERKGFFSGIKSWWDSEPTASSLATANVASKTNESLDLVGELRKELSDPEEKQKLYKAIGYDEIQKMIEYPLGYVAQIFHFKINTFNVAVVDEQKKRTIARFVMDEVQMNVHILPTSNGIELNSSIKSMKIFGLQSAELPMVEPLSTDSKTKMLEISFEMNPWATNLRYDFGVRIKSQGLRFVYDVDTIKELTSIGQNYDPQNLQQIQTMAAIKLNELKKRSGDSLVQALREHKKLKLELEIEPSFLLVPENGNMNICADVLIVSIGRIQIASQLVEQNQNEIKQILQKNSHDFLKKLRQSAYENYQLNIRHVQIVLSRKAHWKEDVVQMAGQSEPKALQSQHLLRPFTMKMVFSRSIIVDSPDISQYKVESTFTSVEFIAKSEQVVRLLRLANSVIEPTHQSGMKSALSLTTIPTTIHSFETFNMPKIELPVESKDDEEIESAANMTIFFGKFVIESILFEARSDSDDILFRIRLTDLNAKLVSQTKAIRVEAIVTSMQLLFCVDHFTKLMQLQEEIQQTLEIAQISRSNAVENELQVKVPQKKPQNPKKASSFAIKGQFYLYKAEFALIGDLNIPSSPVVAFNVTLLASMEQLANVLHFNADLQQTQMAITNVSKFTSETGNGMYILNPCDIYFHFHQDGATQKINLSFSEFVIYASPNLVEILFSMLNKLSFDKSIPKDPEVTMLGKKQKMKLFSIRPLKASAKYWFLAAFKTESVAIDLVDQCETSSTSSSTPLSPSIENVTSQLVENHIIVHLPTIQLVIESGGSDTKPMLKLQASLMVQFENYNNLNAKVNLFVEYFNEKKLAWEPVIDKIDNEAWPFEISWKMIEQPNSLTKLSEISIESKNRLEVTLTDNCLFVLNDLGKWFSNAVTQPEELMRMNQQLILSNHTGLPIYFIVDTSKFKLKEADDAQFNMCKKTPEKTVCVQSGSVCALDMIGKVTGQRLSYYFVYNDVESHRSIELDSKQKRVYSMKAVTYPGGMWRYVVDMTRRDVRSKHVSFQSVVEIKNHLNLRLQVYYNCENETKHLADVDFNQSLYLPLELVHSENPYVYIKPEGYLLPLNALTWRSVHSMHKKSIWIDCDSNQEEEAPYFIRAVTDVHILDAHETPNDDHSEEKVFVFDLYPPFLLRNLLPYPITFKQFKPNLDEEWLMPGQTSEIKRFKEGESVLLLKLDNYQGISWTAFISDLHFSKEDLVRVCQLTGKRNGSEESMLIALNFANDENGQKVLFVFAPFWMINQTGRDLKYSLDDEVFLKSYSSVSDPLLLCFKAKNLTSKKRIRVAMPGCLFSDPFPIDVVGTKGSFVIPTTERQNLLNLCSVDIVLSHFLFTKIVKISAYYTINSALLYPIEVSEDNEVWCQVSANGSEPFWPGNTKNPVLFFRQIGSETCSRSVSVSETSGTLLLVNDSVIYCQVQTTDHSITVNLSNYYKGCAPALLINYTNNLTLNFGQSNTCQQSRLPAKNKVYYTWYEPTAARQLTWWITDSEKKEISLDHDEFGQLDQGGVYWVCFLNRMQRILLVTQNAHMAEYVFQAQELQKPQMQIEVALNGLGVSFVDTSLFKELCYFSISSSEVIWEHIKKKARRHKGFSVKTNEQLEAAYQKYQQISQLEAVGSSHKQTIGSDMQVDFSKMQIYAPVSGHLRRQASIGLRMRLGLSDHIKQMYLTINSIQLDNQLEDCIFKTVFCPVSPPKSIVLEMVPQPFIQCSVLMHSQENQRRFKYLSLLVQEFAIQIDLDFVNGLQSFFGALNPPVEADYEKLVALSLESARFNDRKKEGQLDEINANYIFFDLLHFSPIKMHLSFSLGTVGSFQLNFIFDYLAKTAGVTLIEFRDAVFKINFFERKNVIMRWDQLAQQSIEHYKSQALSQAFIVVLGLDVIGNPVGLLLGLKQGVGDLFYEPLMGIIQGPEEFAEGLVFGIRSLFSSTVGGAAGVLGKITGTIGKGFSVLMETEERKKRRERLNQTKNLVQSSRNLVRGFVTGITGVVTKPFEGAKNEGFEGLVKGVGHGVVGLVAQPTTGIIDFASGALNQLQRTVDINKEVRPVRLRRHLHSNGIVTSYNLHEAKGKFLLSELRKDNHIKRDTYEFHAVLPDGNTLMITDRHVICIEHDKLFNILKPDWYVEHGHVSGVGVEPNATLTIFLNKPKKVLGMFSDKSNYKINCAQLEMAKLIKSKLEQIIGLK